MISDISTNISLVISSTNNLTTSLEKFKLNYEKLIEQNKKLKNKVKILKKNIKNLKKSLITIMLLNLIYNKIIKLKLKN